MRQSFIEGGWGMFPTLFFGVIFVVATAWYAAQPGRRAAALSACLGVLTLTSGLLGFVTGVIATSRGVGQHLDTPVNIAIVGVGESLHNVGLALVAMIIGSLIATIGVVRQTTVPPAPSPDAEPLTQR